jgi:hypothetical protein
MTTNETSPATTQARTPGRWHIDRQSPYSPMCIKPYPGRIVCDIDGTDGEAEANAAFIVRACNAHQELVGALQLAAKAVKTRLMYETFGSAEYQEQSWTLKSIDSALNNAHAKAA